MSSPVVEGPQTRSSSRFLPGVFAGVIGCLFLAFVANRFWEDARREIVPGEEVPPATTAISADSDAELKQLLAQFREREDSELIPVTIPRETTENLPPAEPELQSQTPVEPALDVDSLDFTIFEPGADEGQSAETLPEWAAVTDEADGLPAVVQSTPHATVDDAEQAAFEQLSRELAEAFASDHPEAAGWVPSVEKLRELGVVGRRAVEESSIQVGEFVEPVYRSFLEVVRPENLDSQLETAWRADTVNTRLMVVGGVMGLLTLMFGTLAGYFRLDDATRGKYRRGLRWGTAAVWIAAGSALAIVA